MIRAGTATQPDILPYDARHAAIWVALAEHDRNRLASTLSVFAAESQSVLIHATAGAALVELGQADKAVALLRSTAGRVAAGATTAAIGAAIERGEDPFSVLAEQARLGDGARIGLQGLVAAILSGGDQAALRADLERVLSRACPPVNVPPSPGYAAATVILNLFYPPRFLNVGGGERFMHPFWVNADIVALPGAGPRLRFSPETVLPLRDGSIELAYSSHCLEHLDDASVARMLREMRRVLRADGRLVLKLPDAEDALRQWQAGNPAYFEDPNWGLESVNWSWGNRGIADTLDNRFAMLFCGYWNEAMTRPGTLQQLAANGAFHGPPRVTAEELRALAKDGSPHRLAQGLRTRALQIDPEARFNHQNAWSAAELTALLEGCGFGAISTAAGEIVARCPMIPDILVYRSTSLYAEARPASATLSSPGPSQQLVPSPVPRADQQVTPAAAAHATVRISASNAGAWHPATLANVEPRVLRPGLIRLQKVLWEYHLDMVRRLRAGREPSNFLSYGYVLGQVAPDLLVSMARIFESTPFLFELDDFRADGFHSELKPDEVEDLRRNLRYYGPETGQKAAIDTFLAGIRVQIEQELQTPWQVLNVRCYDTAISFRSGPQLWHTDGFPSAILKILIYLTDDGAPVNGSELVDLQGRRVAVTGRSGTWLLFDPNRLVHRGPVEGRGPRRIIEVTLCPSLTSDTTYRFGGTNYRHPLCPPTIDLFQQGLLLQVQPLARTIVQAAQELTALERKAGTAAAPGSG